MGQVLLLDDISRLQRDSNDIVSLPPSRITIGGQQYNTQTLFCDITTSGFGGLDTGSPTSHTVLYFYAVRQSGVTGLIASLNSTAPSGFTAYKFVGSFNVNFNTELGGLIHDSNRLVQEIKFWVGHPATFPTSPALANGVQSTLIMSDSIEEDSHRSYDSTTGIYYIPFTKSYAGSMHVGLSGSFANNGTITCAIMQLGSFGGNLVVSIQRNSASSGSHSEGAEFSNYPLVIGDQVFATVTPSNWSSVSLAGSRDDNNFSIKG